MNVVRLVGRAVMVSVVGCPPNWATLSCGIAKQGAQKLMEKFCRTHLPDCPNHASYIVPGIAYDEIIKKAQEVKADLIVLGTHGRTGLDHVLFGSTAEKVVRKSPIPVMTIRISEPEKE